MTVLSGAHARGARWSDGERRSVRPLPLPLRVVTIAMALSGLSAAESTDINVGACLRSAGYAEAPLSRTDEGAWLAVATLDSHGVRVLVDPRAPYTLLDAATLRKLGYTLTPSSRDVVLDGAREPIYRVLLANFALGKRNADSLWFDAARITAIRRAAGVDEKIPVAGIVGADMLRRSNALLDMEHDRLFLGSIRQAPIDTVETRYRRFHGKQASGDTLLGELEKRLRRRESTKGESVGRNTTEEKRRPRDSGETETQE